MFEIHNFVGNLFTRLTHHIDCSVVCQILFCSS